ncbi:xenobiotic-transporting ATPase [Clostridium putrefaciens]|uniref:Xenobiotic-transporting ATPase n=1 Tax=Clostridium putrefaciens TaxID=99675 RepID=A0A381J423_9CLOT|nr:ABC transporter ATP-binding protein [Clostridium putrefaciens]SUY45378.1 xenobiotic-transporting ATPase [Clostridium putrefaciens]
MNDLKKKIKRNYTYKTMFGITFIIYMFLNLYIINILQKLIDFATKKNVNMFLKYIKIFIIILILQIIFIVLEQYFFRKVINYGNLNLNKFTFKSFLNNKSFYESSNDPGKVVSQITSDVPIISQWISIGLTTTIIQVIILVLCIGLLAMYNIGITLFIILIIIVTFIFARFISIKSSENMKRFQNILEEISKKAYEGFKSVSIIKQLNKNKYFSDTVYEISNKRSILILQNISKYNALENSELNFLADTLPLFTFIIGVFLSTSGRLSIGSALAIMLITQKLNEPIIILAELLTEKKIADEIYNRIKELYDNSADEEDVNKLPVTSFKKLNIEVNEYTFPNKKDSLLNDINLEIKRGDLISLNGESGKGKTTLINLISRFLPTDGLSGKISYNGEDIEGLKINDYYKHVLQVEQNAVLIEGTLKENLLLGDEYLKEDLKEILYTCCLENFLNTRGIDYHIKEDGKNISGGEKQRIGLARILLRRPDLLILDEVTSALNEEIREEIVKRIINYKEKYNLTLIVISHNNDFKQYSNKTCQL